MDEKLYKIGELAELSGVPVKTIRFYSDIGALPPTRVLESGYRLYSHADRVRLDLIRTLRELDVDLPTIIDLLKNRVSVVEALSLQLEAVEMELRMLRRRQTLLKAALRKGEAAALSFLDQARSIVKLRAVERERFLSRHLERAFDGVPVDETWKANFWQAAVLDLPEEMTDLQLEAWLELAEIISDEGFIQRLNETSRATWEMVDGRHGAAEWSRELHELYQAAIEVMQAGDPPEGAPAQQLVEAYIQTYARAMGRHGESEFPAHLLDVIERSADPRAERYWELIAILKGWTEMPPIAAAHRWLVEGLRWYVARGHLDAPG